MKVMTDIHKQRATEATGISSLTAIAQAILPEISNIKLYAHIPVSRGPVVYDYTLHAYINDKLYAQKVPAWVEGSLEDWERDRLRPAIERIRFDYDFIMARRAGDEG